MTPPIESEHLVTLANDPQHAETMLIVENHLAALPPEVLRQILSRLAAKTPGTIYFGSDWADTMQAAATKEAVEPGAGSAPVTPLSQALLWLAGTAGRELAVGDTMKASFTSIEHGNENMGDFTVAMTRTA